MSALAERLGSKRTGSNRDHKEYRLSKALIGQPIIIEGNGKLSDIADTTDTTAGPSMVMKCVLVQRDDKGYGLTVSGDNPVYVQSVKEDGAAAKTGVLQGDRILKVNGSNVTDLNHVEVVKLIKADTYVALTLLGLPAPSGSSAPSSGDVTSLPSHAVAANFITAPTPPMAPKHQSFYDQKVDTIKKMLETEKAEVERIKEEYARNPEQKILLQLGAAQKLKQDLEKQLWKVESMKDNEEDKQATAAAVASVTDIDASFRSQPSEDLMSLIDMEYSADVIANEDVRGTSTEPSRERRSQTLNELSLASSADVASNNTLNMVAGDEHANMDLINEFQPNNPFVEQPVPPEGSKPVTPQQNRHIMNFEEDDIVDECGAFQDHGPFNDLEKLRQRPAHFAVFFNYVISSHEPANLLLTVAVDSFKQLTSSKETNKTAESIFRTYLAPNAPLKVVVDDGITKSIQGVISGKNVQEETLKGVFDPAVQAANKEIRWQLSQYRMKREQGLGSLFGDEKLPNFMHNDQQHEARIVDEVITPTLTELLQSSCLDDIEQVRLTIKQEALQAFLNQYGTKRKSKITSRMISILRPKQPQPLIKSSRVSGSMESILDDQMNKRSSGIGGIFGSKGKKGRSDGNALNVHHSPHVHEPSLGDGENVVGNLIKHFQEEENDNASDSDNLSVDKKSLRQSRSGSFRRRRDEEKRLSGTPKSHSDPDKNKVEQAVVQHNASSDQLDQLPRHHALSTTDSTLSLSVEERKIMDHLPSFVGDKEIDIDASEQHWSETVPHNVIRGIDRKEVKRQEVIYELMCTERHHVRDLSILKKLFYEPLQSDSILTSEELDHIFPNLNDILHLHKELNKSFEDAKLRDGHVVKNVGDILLEMFDGTAGNNFKEECAIYCGNQSHALGFIKDKAKKVQKFTQYIEAAQRLSVCRKLHLKDFIPMEFQRLTKYPLLLENIIKNTKKKQEKEIEKIRKACDRCRDILAFVNQAVKEAEDKEKIREIQQNLDRSPLLKSNNASNIVNEFKNIDLTSHAIIHHGTLTWKLGQMDKRKEIALHCILYEDVFVLLQKQDDKYVLKFYGSEKGVGITHAPFLATEKLIVRSVATDKRAFFVMSTSNVGPQMYQFVASSSSVVKQWMQLLVETSKKKDAQIATGHRRKAFVVPGSSRDVDDHDLEEELDVKKRLSAGDLIGTGVQNRPDGLTREPILENSDEFPISPPPSPVKSPLDPVTTIFDKIQSKHQMISDALASKVGLLAEMAGIGEDKLESVLEMSTVDTEPEPSTLVMHSLLCVDKLTGLLNECAVPESTFINRRTESNTDTSTSNRLSVEGLETGYQTDSGPTSPPERWAVAVPHPELSGTEDRPLSPHELSTATLNSVSDLPLSDSAPMSPSDGEMSPIKRPHDGATDEEPAETVENDDFFETSEQLRTELTTDNADWTSSPTKNVESTSQFETPRNLSVPDDTGSEKSKSRPLSGVELCARAGIVPVSKMMDIVVSLQTQLTQLMHVIEEADSDRQRVAAENQQLREELEKMENEQPNNDLPAYEDVVQGR